MQRAGRVRPPSGSLREVSGPRCRRVRQPDRHRARQSARGRRLRRWPGSRIRQQRVLAATPAGRTRWQTGTSRLRSSRTSAETIRGLRGEVLCDQPAAGRHQPATGRDGRADGRDGRAAGHHCPAARRDQPAARRGQVDGAGHGGADMLLVRYTREIAAATSAWQPGSAASRPRVERLEAEAAAVSGTSSGRFPVGVSRRIRRQL